MGIADWGLHTELVSRRGFLCRVVCQMVVGDDELSLQSLNLKVPYSLCLKSADGGTPLTLMSQARHEMQKILIASRDAAESPFCEPAQLVDGYRVTMHIPVYEAAPRVESLSLSAVVLPVVPASSKLEEGGRYIYAADGKLRVGTVINGALLSESGNPCDCYAIYGPFDIVGQ